MDLVFIRLDSRDPRRNAHYETQAQGHKIQLQIGPDGNHAGCVTCKSSRKYSAYTVQGCERAEMVRQAFFLSMKQGRVFTSSWGHVSLERVGGRYEIVNEQEIQEIQEATEQTFVSGPEYNDEKPFTGYNNHPIEGPTYKLEGGELISLIAAPYTHVCGQCLAPSKRHNMGLKCSENPEHRGFVSNAEAKQIKELQQEYTKELESVYKIVGGKVMLR